ncbi:PEP-CTERM sorting domain-containing protein [Desulfolithobacter sp.]
MNKVSAALIASVFLILLAVPQEIGATLIPDNYWGAGGWNSSTGTVIPGDRDVRGPDFIYDITAVEVAFADTLLEVTIQSNLFLYWQAGLPFIEAPGDLFISTDGWNPDGSAASSHNEDYFGNGEQWEAVIHLSGLFSGSSGLSSGGTATLFAVDDSSIVHGGPDELQETWYDPGDTEVPLDEGSWILNDEDQDGQIDSMVITMDLDSLDPGPEIGLHWTDTGANDVIEGGVPVAVTPVPEPAAMVLFGAGLAGLAGFAGKKRHR